MENTFRKDPYCAKCQYRSGKFAPYSCDYAGIMGTTRKATKPGKACKYRVDGARLIAECTEPLYTEEAEEPERIRRTTLKKEKPGMKKLKETTDCKEMDRNTDVEAQMKLRDLTKLLNQAQEICENVTVTGDMGCVRSVTVNVRYNSAAEPVRAEVRLEA